jgi:hypothetical protein
MACIMHTFGHVGSVGMAFRSRYGAPERIWRSEADVELRSEYGGSRADMEF